MSVLQGSALQPIREQAYAPALSANKRLPRTQLQVFPLHFDFLFLFHAPVTDSNFLESVIYQCGVSPAIRI